MSWLMYSLLALTCFVAYALSAKKLVTRAANPQVFAAIFNFFVAVMTPFLFFLDQTVPGHLSLLAILFTIVGFLIWGLFGRLEYFARAHSEASIFSITMDLAPVLNFFLALLVLRESVTVNKLVGVALIIAANLLLYIGTNRKSVISDKGLYFSLSAAVFLALGWLFDAINVKSLGIGTLSILSFLGPTLISSIFPAISIAKIKKELSLNPWWHIWILAFFNLAGYAGMLKALTLGEATKVIPIINSSTPFIVLFGVIILGERNHVGRKIWASILAVCAIYLMR